MGSSAARRRGSVRLRRSASATAWTEPFNQGVGAEMIAERWGLSRAQLDEYALASHAKAAGAGRRRSTRRSPRSAGRRRRRGHPPRHHPGEAGRAADPVQGRRRGHRRLRVADLRRRGRARGHHLRWAAAHGLRPLARMHTAVVAADDPVIMLTAPHPGHREGAGQGGTVHRRHRGVRGERGVRAGAAGLAGGDRRRPGPAQPARRRDRAGPPARAHPARG